MKRYLAALLLVPLVDALLLVVVADYLGWVATVLLVVLTALVGTLLVRAEGRHTIRRIQQRLERGEPPTDELIDGGLLIAAGAFLLTPGLVTDAIGLLLVVPVTRYPIRKLVKRVGRSRIDVRTGGLASGKIYTAGFPGDAGFGVGGGDGRDDDARRDPYEVDHDAYDVDDDAYEVDVEDGESDA